MEFWGAQFCPLFLILPPKLVPSRGRFCGRHAGTRGRRCAGRGKQGRSLHLKKAHGDQWLSPPSPHGSKSKETPLLSSCGFMGAALPLRRRRHRVRGGPQRPPKPSRCGPWEQLCQAVPTVGTTGESFEQGKTHGDNIQGGIILKKLITSPV